MSSFSTLFPVPFIRTKDLRIFTHERENGPRKEKFGQRKFKLKMYRFNTSVLIKK